MIANADNPRGLATRELYNLERDPGETTNLAASEPDVVEEMLGSPKLHVAEVLSLDAVGDRESDRVLVEVDTLGEVADVDAELVQADLHGFLRAPRGRGADCRTDRGRGESGQAARRQEGRSAAAQAADSKYAREWGAKGGYIYACDQCGRSCR